MIEKVAFTMVPVRDAERARAFYGETLGLTKGLQSPEGAWTEYDLPGGGCIALFYNTDLQAPSDTAGSSVALEVQDLDALNATLKGRGVTYKADLIKGPNCRMSVILDSEGNALILHQLDKK